MGLGAKGKCRWQEKVRVGWCSAETAGYSASLGDNLRLLTPVTRQGNLSSSCTCRARVCVLEAATDYLAGPDSSVEEEGCTTQL